MLEFLNSFVMNVVSLPMFVNLAQFVFSVSFTSHLIVCSIELNLFKSDVSYLLVCNNFLQHKPWFDEEC